LVQMECKAYCFLGSVEPEYIIVPCSRYRVGVSSRLKFALQIEKS